MTANFFLLCFIIHVQVNKSAYAQKVNNMRLPPVDMYMEHMQKAKNYAEKTNRAVKTAICNSNVNKIRCPKFLKNFLDWLEQIM